MRTLTAWSTLAAVFAAVLILAPAEIALGKPKGSAICMTAKTKSGKANDFTFYVAKKRQTELTKEGFRRINCKFAKEDLALYRERICKFANTLPDPAQRVFDNAHGITAKKLCRLASEVQG